MLKSGEILRDVIMTMSQQMIHVNIKSFKKNKRLAVKVESESTKGFKPWSSSQKAIEWHLPEAGIDGVSQSYCDAWYRALDGLKTLAIHLVE